MKEAPLHEVQASPGEMLKALREERKLSVQDIAAKLYLDVGIIEALEQNNFNALPASTYARGYFRSYARLVGADADLIIAIYNKVAPDPPEIIPEVRRHPTQLSSRDKPIQAITWVIFLVIGLLVLSWLQNNNMVPGIDLSGDGSVKNAAQTTVTAVAPAQSANPATADIAADILADVAPEESENELTYTVTTPDQSPIPATGGDLTELVEAGVSAALTATETAGDATTQPTAIGGTITQGTDTLKLRLTADSWVEVADRDGHFLYENLARTGDQISLSGAAPFVVKLGFAQGVILEFNGEPFDPAPYSRAGVASFTLE